MSRGHQGLLQQDGEIMDRDGVSGVKRIVGLLVYVAAGAVLDGLTRNGIGCDYFQAAEPLVVLDTNVLVFLDHHCGRDGSMAIDVNRPTEDDKDGEGDKNEGDEPRTTEARRLCADATHRARVSFICQILRTGGNLGIAEWPVLAASPEVDEDDHAGDCRVRTP